MSLNKIIYAVIENNVANQSLFESDADGIDGMPLEIVSYRDIAAVISIIDAARFDASAQDAAPEQLKSDLLKYQQVNAYLLEKTGGMLPLKFGLTAIDNQAVESVLERAYLQLRTHLDRLKNKVELVIQASWDMSKVIPEIARLHPEFISTDPIQTGKLLFEAVEMQRKGYIDAIHSQLSPLAQDFAEGAHKTKSLILNRSYLVDVTQEAHFDAAVNTLGERYDAIIDFRYIGSLPAYSFINIELNQGNFALLDQSRKTLQLPELAAWRQVKSAYRQLLLANHPDQNPDDPDASNRCRAIVSAFEVVSAYCQSFQHFAERGYDAEYIFTRHEVEKVFIVNAKSAALPTSNLSQPRLKHSSISL